MQVQGSRLEHDLFVEDVHGLRFYSQNILRRNIGKTANDIIIELSRQLGVECPPNSEGVRQPKANDGSQRLADISPTTNDSPSVAPLRRRETQSDAETIREKQPSGNGRQNYSTIGRSSANVSIGSSEEKTHLQKPAVDMAVIPSLTPRFDLFSVEVMPRRQRTADDAAIEAEIIPLRERVLDALSRLEDCEVGTGSV